MSHVTKTEPNIIVYTCVTDNYDGALLTVTNEPGVSFVCFTDHPGKLVTPGWEVRPLQSPPHLSRGHDINRYHKFFPHHLFPDARWSIYIDGNVRYDGLFANLTDRVQDNKAEIGAFWHPHAHTLKKETEVCGLSKFDDWDFARVEDQLAAYAGDGIDLNAQIHACYLLVRDHASPRLAHAMSLWWSQIFEFTKRDQISFSWVVQQTGIKLQSLDGHKGIDPALVERLAHNRAPLWKRAVRKAKKAIGSEN